VPSGLWIGILGPLVVAGDGVELPALPPGQRVVLGLLAQAAGAPVQRDTIVDALWGYGTSPQFHGDRADIHQPAAVTAARRPGIPAGD